MIGRAGANFEMRAKLGQGMRVLGAILAVAFVCGARAADWKQTGPLGSSASLVAARDAAQSAFEAEYRIEGDRDAETVTIDIADGVAMLTRDRHISIFDYGQKRFIDLDDAAHKFRNDSWYAVVDSWIRSTAQARARRLAKEPGFDPFWVQSELHVMDARDGVPEIVRNAAADGTVHDFYAGPEVATFKPSEHRLSAEEARRFGRFLASYSALHPKIVADIVASGAVPVRLSYLVQAGDKTVNSVWTLQSFAEVKAVSPLQRPATLDLTGRPELASGLLGIVGAAIGGAAPGKRNAAAFETLIAKALAKRRPFQALLLALERDAQYGACQKPCRATKRIEAAAKRDRRTAALDEKLPLDQAIASLKTMKRGDLTDAVLLDARLGHVLLQAGHVDEALPVLAGALRADPYLPGPYLDLGNAYRAQGDSLTAWLFYDLGRALPGGADALKGVTAFEDRMAKTHPELF